MAITAVQWADAAHTAYLVTTDDGVTSTVPIDGRLAACRDAASWAALPGNAVAPAPAVAPSPPQRRQLGGTFLAAVADLGWWGWMDQGAAAQAADPPNGAGKPVDARYWSTIGKADTVLATDAKLIRVARAAEAARVAASGGPAPASPVITLGAVFDRGDAIAAS